MFLYQIVCQQMLSRQIFINYQDVSIQQNKENIKHGINLDKCNVRT